MSRKRDFSPLFSSEKHDWATPRKLAAELVKEFGITFDVCADETNAVVECYFDERADGLFQNWGTEVCWMNSPYGREIGKWVRKAVESSLAGATVVCLLPSRTGTQWFHHYVQPFASEIRFLKGRLKFGDAKNSAPFDSMIVVFRPPKKETECDASFSRFLSL